MKKVYIVHGWEGNPEEPMLQFIKKSLEQKDFQVIAPEMPNSEAPEINAWVGKLKEVVNELSSLDIFIGHSIGCQAILRFFETLSEDKKVSKCIFIAPWMHLDEKTIEEEGEEVVEVARPWVEIPINWEKVKIHCDNFIAIFSSNDPYVPLDNKKILGD